MSPAPLLVTISDAASMLGVSRRTLYRLVEAGQLQPVTICRRPRIRVSDLKKLAGEPVGEPENSWKLFPAETSMT